MATYLLRALSITPSKEPRTYVAYSDGDPIEVSPLNGSVPSRLADTLAGAYIQDIAGMNVGHPKSYPDDLIHASVTPVFVAASVVDSHDGAKRAIRCPVRIWSSFNYARTLSSRCMHQLYNTGALSGLLTYTYFSQDSPRMKVVRGVISDGIEWEFIILHLNENGRVGDTRYPHASWSTAISTLPIPSFTPGPTV